MAFSSSNDEEESSDLRFFFLLLSRFILLFWPRVGIKADFFNDYFATEDKIMAHDSTSTEGNAVVGTIGSMTGL